MSSGFTKSKAQQFRDFAFYFMFIAFAVIAFSFLTNAATVERISVKAVVPNSLIIVDGDLDFNSVLPGYSYQRELLISLNLTPEMLHGITSENVTVFVNVQSSKSTSASVLFFEIDGVESRRASFVLTCVLYQGECTRSSPLSKVVKVRLIAPASESGVFDENIIVNATLDQQASGVNLISESQKINTNVLQAMENFGKLKQQIEALGLSSNLSGKVNAVESSLGNASSFASALDVERAKIALSNAEVQLSELNQTVSKTISDRVNVAHGLFLGADTAIPWQPIGVFIVAVCVLLFFLYRHKGKERNVDFNKLINNSKYYD
ncbi:MAG: hypothetical protein V1644_03385 [Candidatus Micrarchaeota archaeon]